MARPKKAPEVEPATEEIAEVPATEPTPEVEAPEVEPATEGEDQARYETFEATRPDGTVVEIYRNLDTGEQTVTEKQ